jgi:iron complex transport system permease protein
MHCEGDEEMKPPLLAAWLVGAALLLALLGLQVGSEGFEILRCEGLINCASFGLQSAFNGSEAAMWQVIMEIRLPRGLGAWGAGALLGLAGALAQGLFRNPLADPFLLGSASGATLGVVILLAALGISPMALSALQSLGLTGAAFLGALGAVSLTLVLAQGVSSPLRLLLAGVVVGVVLGALSSLLLTLAPEVMLAVQGFMLGSTSFLGWSAVAVLLAALLICLPVALLAARALDGLQLGDAAAQSLGLPLPAIRLALVAVISLATGAAVAQTGLIAFVGLAAPHLVRGLCRAQHRSLIVLSALCGGVLLQASDLLARGLAAPRELPVGVLTAVLGGAYLLWLMRSGAQSENSSHKETL